MINQLIRPIFETKKSENLLALQSLDIIAAAPDNLEKSGDVKTETVQNPDNVSPETNFCFKEKTELSIQIFKFIRTKWDSSVRTGYTSLWELQFWFWVQSVLKTSLNSLKEVVNPLSVSLSKEQPLADSCQVSSETSG